jgi:hypothetical protein
VTDSSDRQKEKHSEQRISTLRGIKIDRSDERENAFDSVRVKREFDSNETEASLPDSRKRRGGRMGIEESNQNRTESQQISGLMEAFATLPFSTTIRRWQLGIVSEIIGY